MVPGFRAQPAQQQHFHSSFLLWKRTGDYVTKGNLLISQRNVNVTLGLLHPTKFGLQSPETCGTTAKLMSTGWPPRSNEASQVQKLRLRTWREGLDSLDSPKDVIDTAAL